jgi:osomolarity two-component system sensor histidine kinase TcsA
MRDGIHIGFSKVTRDLTERKAAESRVVAAYEESAKLKSAFLANTSHEIRTPLHGMLSALTLLMDTKLTPEQRELGSIIEESGSVLLQVINDILDYSKLSSGVFSVSVDTVVSIPSLSKYLQVKAQYKC